MRKQTAYTIKREKLCYFFCRILMIFDLATPVVLCFSGTQSEISLKYDDIINNKVQTTVDPLITSNEAVSIQG